MFQVRVQIVTLCWHRDVIATDLVVALEEVLDRYRHGACVSPAAMHERVREMYKWQDVAERTEKASVYHRRDVT